jgi:hypothetical protein
MYVALFGSRLYFQAVQHTYTNKDPLIYAATSTHTAVSYLTVLTTVTLASTNDPLPDDGVAALKHVGAVLMYILILFLRQFTCASVGE